MGVSTDAILFFGACIDDDGDTHAKIVSDMAAGPEGEPIEGTMAWLAYMGDEEGGCVVGTHCSGECPMYYVAIRESIVKAWRGRPQDLTNALIVASGDPGQDRARVAGWSARIAVFRARHGFRPDDPRWWLASYWG